jgi:O-antigen ligase
VSQESWYAATEEGSQTGRLVAVALVAGAVLGIGVALASPVFAVLGLAGLAIAIAVFVRPELGVLGFVAVAHLLPFGVIPVRLGLSLTFVDAVLTAVLLAWLYWALQRGRPFIGSALNLPILLYVALALTSFVLGLTYSISPERLRLFIKSINSILLFFSVLNCVRDLPALRRATMAVVLAGTGAAAIALVLHYLPEATTVQLLSALGPLGYPTGSAVLRPIADTNIMRAIGTSVDPNVLGGLLMLVASLLFGQFMSREPLLPKKALVPMIAAVAVALLLTQSRSAFGGMIVGAVVVGTFRDRRILLLVLATLVLLPFLPRDWVWVERLWSGLAFEDRGAAMRLGEYEDAIQLIALYPWFGIGFGEPPSIDLYLGVSSMYLMVGQEMGLLGMGAFLAVLAVLAVQMAAGLKEVRDEGIKGILLGLAAALAAAAAAGLLDHYFVNILFPHMVAIFWLYAGLSMVAVRLARNPA